MRSILLAPHNDDETLFAAFTIMRWQPRVIVCLRSEVQALRGTGITAEQRTSETACAMDALGADWNQWPFSDAEFDTSELARMIEREKQLGAEHVFAPAPEIGGHAHHNLIGTLAIAAFGTDAFTGYYTYVNGRDRSRIGIPVEPEPHWIALKHCALSCYESQIAEPSTSHHFLADLNEYTTR